jgi:hypothetical protein
MSTITAITRFTSVVGRPWVSSDLRRAAADRILPASRFLRARGHCRSIRDRPGTMPARSAAAASAA